MKAIEINGKINKFYKLPSTWENKNVTNNNRRFNNL